jgi:tight adherence protein B
VKPPRDVRFRRAIVALAAALVARAFLPAVALGAEPMTLHVRSVSLGQDGTTRLVVAVTGNSAAPSFTVAEGGTPVGGVSTTPLFASQVSQAAVVLAMDVSGSTAGKAFADAKAAAAAFVRSLPDSVGIELIAFGARASVAVPFTKDHARVQRSIQALRANGETALYDAVALASKTLGMQNAQPNIVVFTDGRDTVSRATLANAVADARRVKSPVTTIALRTPDLDAAALRALSAGTSGRALAAGSSSSLAAAFASAAKDLASQFVLTYTVTGAPGPKDLSIVVTARDDAAVASDLVATINPRTFSAPTVTVARTGSESLVHRFFTTRAGLYAASAAFFVALAIMLAIALVRTGEQQAGDLLRRIGASAELPAASEEDARTGLATTPFGRATLKLLERLPKRHGLEDRVQLSLDRAGWPLRATEFMMLRAGAALAGFLLGGILVGRVWLGGVAAIAGFMLPKLVLGNRVARRRAHFLAQLPDSLQLISGSLRAGAGFLQSVDTLVKEASSPTRDEFTRVLTQTRLGMPLEDSLNMMAERIGSDDFRWVVLAVNIQRQAGGNLAVLLETVGNTLRERDQVRRQIKVLAAEGKLSATILTVLPFLLAGYITLVNPSYLTPLVHETIGKIMIAGALGMMGMGMLWMRKIIRIDV